MTDSRSCALLICTDAGRWVFVPAEFKRPHFTTTVPTTHKGKKGV